MHLKKSDPVMRGIIERVGPCRISYQEPEFKILARAIVFQQLNGTAAAAIFGRLETLCSRPGAGLQPEGVLRAPLKMSANVAQVAKIPTFPVNPGRVFSHSNTLTLGFGP